MNSKPATGEPKWVWRRSAILLVIGYACWRLAVLEGAADTAVNQSISWGWQILIAALLFVYTGFATVQDVMAMVTTKSAMPYAPAPAQENPELPPEQRAG